MSATPQESMQLNFTPETRRQLEAEAARLNLSVAAYVQYLHSRLKVGIEPVRFDRMVNEIFGHYGQTMRNLAK